MVPLVISDLKSVFRIKIVPETAPSSVCITWPQPCLPAFHSSAQQGNKNKS